MEQLLKKYQQKSGYNEVVSIGGGSVIDAGKYIAFHLKLPHTAIPTTAGTGSEMTKYIVITENGTKKTLSDERYIPTNFILDSTYVKHLPLEQTISTGLDALSQSIESYWSLEANEESRRWAELAIGKIMGSFLKSCNDLKNEELRLDMLVGANYSGRAINISKTSTCHAVSYPLTVHYGIPHGLACAYTLPEMMELNHFTLVRPTEIRELLKKLHFKKIEFDKKLVFKEAQASERFFNTPNVPKYEDLF